MILNIHSNISIPVKYDPPKNNPNIPPFFYYLCIISYYFENLSNNFLPITPSKVLKSNAGDSSDVVYSKFS